MELGRADGRGPRFRSRARGQRRRYEFRLLGHSINSPAGLASHCGPAHGVVLQRYHREEPPTGPRLCLSRLRYRTPAEPTESHLPAIPSSVFCLCTRISRPQRSPAMQRTAAIAAAFLLVSSLFGAQNAQLPDPIEVRRSTAVCMAVPSACAPCMRPTSIGSTSMATRAPKASRCSSSSSSPTAIAGQIVAANITAHGAQRKR